VSAEENQTLVRRYFAAIDARRNPVVVDEFLATDFGLPQPISWLWGRQ
jgi:hypothetical protein